MQPLFDSTDPETDRSDNDSDGDSSSDESWDGSTEWSHYSSRVDRLSHEEPPTDRLSHEEPSHTEAKGYEISLLLDDETLERSDFEITHVVESCRTAPEARKRNLEVTEVYLTAELRKAFTAAIAWECGSWLNNRVVDLFAKKGIYPARLMSCRWALTGKLPDSGDFGRLFLKCTFATSSRSKHTRSSSLARRDRWLDLLFHCSHHQW